LKNITQQIGKFQKTIWIALQKVDILFLF
jgi:hypothetical protein